MTDISPNYWPRPPARTSWVNLIDKDEKDGLLRMLRVWGILDQNYEYKRSDRVSFVRGYDVFPGGGLNSMPVNSDPMARKELLNSSLWLSAIPGQDHGFPGTAVQPVGGMGMIGKAFGKVLNGVIRYNCKVTSVHQDDKGVTATYVNSQDGRVPQTAHADWCVCTIPASVLSQISMNMGAYRCVTRSTPSPIFPPPSCGATV